MRFLHSFILLSTFSQLLSVKWFARLKEEEYDLEHMGRRLDPENVPIL